MRDSARQCGLASFIQRCGKSVKMKGGRSKGEEGRGLGKGRGESGSRMCGV